MSARWSRNAFVTALMFSVLSCTSNNGGGTTGTGFVIGRISGFGSIVVSGIEFDVDEASVTLEGEPATPSDLRLGMVVEVQAAIDEDERSGVAESVAYHDALQGAVEQVDVPNKTIVALGQVVLVDELTVFDGTTLETLVAGDVIEVTGYRDGDGNIRATRIGRLEGEAQLQIEGVVTELDAAAQTFRVGGQLVDFSDAQIVSQPPESLANGVFVEVNTTQPVAGGVLLAETVEVRTQAFPGEEGSHVVVEGIVGEVLAPDEFVLDEMGHVRLLPETTFNGGTAADIVENTFVRVTGSLDDEGALVADDVDFAPVAG